MPPTDLAGGIEATYKGLRRQVIRLDELRHSRPRSHPVEIVIGVGPDSGDGWHSGTPWRERQPEQEHAGAEAF